MPFGFQIEIPSQALEDRIVSALVAGAALPAGITAKQFAVQKIKDWIKGAIANYECTASTNAAFDLAQTKARADFKDI